MNTLDSDNYNILIGKKLKDFFESHKYTQQDIADKLGVSQAAVSALLNGKPFGKKLAKKWGDIFGIKPYWLLTGEGEMLKSNNVNKISDSGNTSIAGNSIINNDISAIKQLISPILSLMEKKDDQIDKAFTSLSNVVDVLKSKDEQINRLMTIIEKINGKYE